MDWSALPYSNTSEFSPCILVQCLGGVPDEVEGAAFGLAVDGANPFRSTVSFTYRLASPGPARLSVYDLSGKHVRTLVSGVAGAGAHGVRWDGKDAQGRAVPAGVYFVDFRSDDHRASRRVVKLK
jgi:hypothetical protein